MSVPPWEVCNTTSSVNGENLDLLKLFTTPLNHLQNIVLILILISLLLIVLGIIEIKKSYTVNQYKIQQFNFYTLN